MEGDKKRSFRLPERPRSLLSKVFRRSESNRSRSSVGSSSSQSLSLEETRTEKVDLHQNSDDNSKSAASVPNDSIPSVSGCPMWEDAISKILNSNEDPKLVAVVNELRATNAFSPNDTVSTIATVIKQDLEREVQSQHAAQGFVKESIEQTVSMINKFLAVGDVAASFDPVHAALPWAAVRFVLVVSFSLVPSPSDVCVDRPRRWFQIESSKASCLTASQPQPHLSYNVNRIELCIWIQNQLSALQSTLSPS